MSQVSLPPLPKQEGVEYRHVPGFPGYCVGADGSVLSCRAVGRSPGFLQVWRPRKLQRLNGKRYLVVMLRPEPGKKVGALVHRLVLEAFRGPCPKGFEACHRDDNHENNALYNLRWDTRSSNLEDKERNGRLTRGSKNGMVKLTEADVKEIRQLATQGVECKEIAAKFNVNFRWVSSIIRGKAWAWLV